MILLSNNNTVNEFTLKSLSIEAEKYNFDILELNAFKKVADGDVFSQNMNESFFVSLKHNFNGNVFHIYYKSQNSFSEALENCIINGNKTIERFNNVCNLFETGLDYQSDLFYFLSSEYSFRKYHLFNSNPYIENDVVMDLINISRNADTPVEAILKLDTLNFDN